MASMTSTARDIPKGHGRDSFAAVAAMSVPVTKPLPLPTPPNSISPSLPPHGIKPYGTRSTTTPVLEHVESDLDLHEASRDGSAESGHDAGSPGFDTTGIITPTLLAKHHLPEILLNHGPLAIRHIMGFLTTAVPGFSGIPPAKARRLVVGALEGRGSGGEGGGVKGNVKFEKVGWGRWDARLKGHAARNSGGNQQSPPPSIPSSYSNGMPIAAKDSWDRTRLNAPGSSWAADSAVFSHDDRDITMLENEADKMSLDGDESCSSSEAPDDDGDDLSMGDDPEDITDDEDWAAVGAAALRAASYSNSGPHGPFSTSGTYNGISRGGGPSFSAFAKSVPMHPQRPNFDLSAFGMTSDSQEREAVEALLRLGSV